MTIITVTYNLTSKWCGMRPGAGTYARGRITDAGAQRPSWVAEFGNESPPRELVSRALLSLDRKIATCILRLGGIYHAMDGWFGKVSTCVKSEYQNHLNWYCVQNTQLDKFWTCWVIEWRVYNTSKSILVMYLSKMFLDNVF